MAKAAFSTAQDCPQANNPAALEMPVEMGMTLCLADVNS
jgi:hypothetical protein